MRKPCPGPGNNNQPCGRPIDSRGLCKTHSYQQRIGRDLTIIRDPNAKKVRITRPAKPGEPVCTGPDCIMVASTRDLCPAHYQQWRKGRPIVPLAEGRVGRQGARTRPAECVGPGIDGKPCGRPVRAINLCSTHRAQQKAGKELTPVRPMQSTAGTCPGPGRDGACGRTIKSRGLCSRHAAEDRAGKPLTLHAERRPATPKAPAKRKPKTADGMPPGWHRKTIAPEKPTKSRSEDGDMFGLLPPHPPATPEQERAAARLLIRRGHADLLECLGLAA